MKKLSVVGKALARLYREQCEEEAKRANELREILEETIWQYNSPQYLFYRFAVIEQAMEEIEQWQKSERKNWALGLITKDEDPTNIPDEMTKQVICARNRLKKEIRKKIEED